MFSCVRVCMYLYNWHINLNRVSRINNFSVYVLLGHVISDEIESVVFSYDGKYVATYDVYLVGTGDNMKVCTVLPEAICAHRKVIGVCTSCIMSVYVCVCLRYNIVA